MSYNLHLLPELEEDLLSGYRWYEEKVPGLEKIF